MEKNNYTKEEVLQLMYQAFESGFKKYEVVDAGLESMETKEECGWILRRYDSDLEKETQKQLIIEIMNEDAKDGLYKKQTAVEWLVSQLNKQGFAEVVTNEEIQKAKEMEKQQSIDFARHCLHKANREFELDILTSFIDVHQYYKEEYGK